MPTFSKIQKLLIGFGALGGATAIYFLQPDKKKVYASWTTSYQVPTYAKWDDNWDHRSPKFLVNPKLRQGDGDEKEENQINEELENYKPKAVRHLILIRHGQYHTNGKTDEQRTLTDLGIVQAEYTGNRLRELRIPYTKLIKSTMQRAQETGTIISQSLPEVPVSNCHLIREGAPIPPEPPLGSWKKEMHQFFIDGSRIEAAFRFYFHRADPKQEKDSYTILVCHANVIRYFVCRALQFPAEGWLRLSLNHGSITWISINPSGRVILRCLGDTGHMPPEVVSSR